jgi:hypothetical protein
MQFYPRVAQISVHDCQTRVYAISCMYLRQGKTFVLIRAALCSPILVAELLLKYSYHLSFSVLGRGTCSPGQFLFFSV